jgi:hypothetical protein
MGHSEVKTTQVYADIIDSVRKDAMHKIPDIGLAADKWDSLPHFWFLLS